MYINLILKSLLAPTTHEKNETHTHETFCLYAGVLQNKLRGVISLRHSTTFGALGIPSPIVDSVAV